MKIENKKNKQTNFYWFTLKVTATCYCKLFYNKDEKDKVFLKPFITRSTQAFSMIRL